MTHSQDDLSQYLHLRNVLLSETERHGGVVYGSTTPSSKLADAALSSLLNPQTNHGLVNIGLAARANCESTATFQVQVFGDEDDQTATDKKGTVFSPDATNLTLGTLNLRAERIDSGDGRVYLILVRGTDAAGNTRFNCNTVVVPHDSSASAMASVNNQAAAAKTCARPMVPRQRGCIVIGDGPVIGPKQ